MNGITETGARIMVQVMCRRFVMDTPADEWPGAWVERARLLQESLGRVLGKAPAADDLKEIITNYEELESVEAGTHPDMEVNAALTVDNRPSLVDTLIQRIDADTTALLVNIRFGQREAA